MGSMRGREIFPRGHGRRNKECPARPGLPALKGRYAGSNRGLFSDPTGRCPDVATIGMGSAPAIGVGTVVADAVADVGAAAATAAGAFFRYPLFS